MNELVYVEMVCDLVGYRGETVSLSSEYTLHPLGAVDAETLYPCYVASFKAGDSLLFHQQNEAEQREFFDSLCLEEARTTPGSSLISKAGRVVGFTYLIPYGEKNCHISCMCVAPEEQRRGLGKVMLDYVIWMARENGIDSITLGTEPAMRAFRLYRIFEFEVIE
jgi:ribosomal protein S18 acetylase RimI-like enzyme